MSCRGRLNSTSLWEKGLLETWTVPNWMRISLGCLGELVLCNSVDEWMELGSDCAWAQVGSNSGPLKLLQMASPPLHSVLTTPVHSKGYFDKIDNDRGVAVSFLQMQQIRWKLFSETVEFQNGEKMFHATTCWENRTRFISPTYFNEC